MMSRDVSLLHVPQRQLWTLLAAALLLLPIASSLAAEDAPNEEPKVGAELFYSEKDAHWAQAKKIIDDIEKKFKTVTLKRINTDTNEGRDTLTDLIKERNLKESGDLVFVFGPFSLVSKGADREVELYMEPLITRILDPKPAKGRVPANVGDYVKEIFGKTATEETIGTPDKDEKIVYHKVSSGGKQVGWVVDAYHPIKCPICSDVQFLLAVDPDFKTLDIRSMRQLERRGRKLEDAEAAKFLGQFKKQLPTKDDLKVDALSGATKTTVAYEEAMNDIINELKKQAGKKK